MSGLFIILSALFTFHKKQPEEKPMTKTIESILIAASILCANPAYSTDKSEIDTSKYTQILSKECSRVRFENNAVICEDSYCTKIERVDCGRKYCVEEGYSERWRLIPKELLNPQLIKRKDTTFPYAISYNPFSIKYKALVFRFEETAKKIMEMPKQ